MPYSVTHVILTIVIVDLYRDYVVKKKFSPWYVLIAGIAGLLPDLDIPVSWVFNWLFKTNYNFHRLYTHSMLWFIVLFFIGLGFYLFAKNRDYKILKYNVPKDNIVLFFMALAFGWFMHILFDCTLAADGLLNVFPGYPISFCMHPFGQDVMVGIDAIILVAWLLHEQWRHEIKDYI